MVSMQFTCDSFPAMSKMVQIRNVPDDLHRELRRRAAAAGMSMSEYLLREVREVVTRPTIEELAERARARDAGVDVADVVAAVRSGRDR